MIGIAFLLHLAFGSGRDAALVMLNLPLALIGGVAGVFVGGGVLSVASLIGFITVLGIATRNGIMLVSHIRHLQEEEGITDLREAVYRGPMERLAPILMTALAAGLALIPLALSGGKPGNEIQNGARTVWLQREREGIAVARCTVEWLMHALRLEGVRRGKRCRTTIPDAAAESGPRIGSTGSSRRRARISSGVADFTYVATWVGFVYVAFVFGVFARRIVGWRVARSMHTDLVLDALEQALWSRAAPQGLVHHSDRGSQYLSSATRSVWPKRGSNPRSAALATPTTTLSPRRSSDCSRPR